MNTTTTTEKIEMTPTWSAILPSLLAVYENKECDEATKFAKIELRLMAQLADAYVAEHKEEAS